MLSVPTFLALNSDCSFRLLEKPYIYKRSDDELYELDLEAADFVQRLPLPVDGMDVQWADAGFLDYCFKEGLLSSFYRPSPPGGPAVQAPTPSLRYLLLHITTRCNLKCKHCFLGDPEPKDLPLDQILRVLEQFEKLQGLRLLVSGGEPFLHPQFWELNERFETFSFRTVILTNGVLLDSDVAQRLRAHEVQISLDGIGPSHDELRGNGAFQRALAGLKNAANAGLDVSVATMAHSAGIHDLDELESLLQTIGVKEWSVDVPSPSGRWRYSDSSALTPEQIGSALNRSYGGGVHDSSEGDWACGAHLCAVMADGSICKCGFYNDSPSGSIETGLAVAWQKIPRMKISDLECGCDFLMQCRGGCRYRAETADHKFGRDPVMCAANGLPRQTSRRR